jgi:formate dehydrogenase subunit gamma
MSQWLKYAHYYLSFPFTLGVVLMFLMWIAWNIPSKLDVNWIKEGGGLVGGRHPPAARFNAGQKMIYWIVVLGGAAAAVSGYLLMFPFYGTNIADMQLAQTVHGVVSMLFIAAMLAISTSAMAWRAPSAMGTGEVDSLGEGTTRWAKRKRTARPRRPRSLAGPAETSIEGPTPRRAPYARGMRIVGFNRSGSAKPR